MLSGTRTSNLTTAPTGDNIVETQDAYITSVGRVLTRMWTAAGGLHLVLPRVDSY
jgi:hypothetical protein